MLEQMENQESCSFYGEVLEEKRFEEINSGAMLALWVLG